MKQRTERQRSFLPFASALLAFASVTVRPDAVARAQAVSPVFWVTNGTVNATAVYPEPVYGNVASSSPLHATGSGPALYIGGTFTRVGPASGSGIPFDV